MANPFGFKNYKLPYAMTNLLTANATQWELWMIQRSILELSLTMENKNDSNIEKIMALTTTKMNKNYKKGLSSKSY